MTELYSDNYYMDLALAEARAAAAEDEIPIGAVVVGGGRVLGRGHNQTERLCDVTAHAEMLALSAAAQALGGKYLSGCTLYVTVEPCPMCAGAIIQSRIKNLYFGAYDYKAGCGGSTLDLFRPGQFNHDVHAEGGYCQEICAGLLSDFFRELRKKR